MSTRYAKLVRGSVYYLGTKRFERGVAQQVSEDQEAHLKDNAVDVVSFTDANGYVANEERQKFEFFDGETESGEAAGEGKAPRTRSRS